jgi:hypothetical protein
MTNALVVVTALVASVASGAQQSADPASAFRLSGPTYFTDGTIRGGSIGLRGARVPTPPVTHTYFQYSGTTLCQSSSATAEAPTNAGYGWRVSVTLLPSTGATNGLEFEVDWQRRWERGAAVSAPRGRSRISLQPGDKVMLDYIPAGAPAPGCDALGMGLQVELLPVEFQTDAIVEADLWLIRKSDNSTIERQTIRMQPGAQTPFFFKDVVVPLTGDPLKVDGTYYFQNRGDAPTMTVRTAGRLTPTGIKGERVTALVELSQGVVAIGGQAGVSARPATANALKPLDALFALMASRGGATFEFSATPSEVVEFKVPQLAGPAGQRSEALAVRIQMRVIGR